MFTITQPSGHVQDLFHWLLPQGEGTEKKQIYFSNGGPRLDTVTHEQDTND